jgi:hypothetical protein
VHVSLAAPQQTRFNTQRTGQHPQQRCVVASAGQSNAAAASATASAPQQQQQQQQQQQLRGKDVVMAFYEAYNVRDLPAIASLIADDISYHDLVYEEPHEGREGVMEWLNKVSQLHSDPIGLHLTQGSI